MASNVRPVRPVRGGPKYRLVPVVFVLLVAVSAGLGWFLAVGL